MNNLISSEIEWIGKIPDDWNLMKIKYIFNERKEMNKPVRTKDLISLTIDEGVIPHSEKKGGGNKPKEDFSKYKIVYPGDIVINSMNVIAGAVGLSRYFGALSPVYYMLFLKNSKFSPIYFHYLFRTEIFQKSLYGLGNGILIKENEDTGKLNTIRMRIPMEKLGNQYIPLPPIKDQFRISTFLDLKIKDNEILIEKLKKRISLLEEQKISTINKYITKGIDQNITYKSSGIDWIGEIPNHWEIFPLKYQFSMKGRIGWRGLKFEEFKEEGAYLITGQDIKNHSIDWSQCYRITLERYEESPEIIVKEKDLLFTKDGTIGKTLYIDSLPGKTSLNSHLLLIRSKNKNYLTKFLQYIFWSSKFFHYVDIVKTGSTFYGVSQYSMENFKFCFPPINEQIEICNKLDKKIDLINTLIKKSKEKISLLKEYQQSLISSAVTGKIRITEDMI